MSPYYQSKARKKGRRLAILGQGNIGSQLAEPVSQMEGLAAVLSVDWDGYELKNRSGQKMGGVGNVGRAKAEVQAERLRALNPALEVEALVGDVETLPWGLLKSDLIVACLDSLAARVAVNQIAWRLGIPWLDGGVDPKRWLGRVNGYWPGHSRPCLECGLTDSDYRAGLRQRHLCRPGADEEPTDGSFELGALVASLLALECSKWLEGDAENGLFGRQFLVDVRHYRQFLTRIQTNPNCRFDHGTWEITGLDGITMQTTLGDLLAQARDQAGYSAPAMVGLENRAFTTRLRCLECSREQSCFCLTDRLTDMERHCPSCGTNTMVASGVDLTEWVGEDLPKELLAHSVEQIGLMKGDIITLRTGDQCRHLEIGRDDVACPKEEETNAEKS